MKSFISEDFLLSTEPARRLYHEYAENMPIFDYHCHLNPREIYENPKFQNIGEAWLAGDHYKWRVMRWNAVPEAYITGTADYHAKFHAFAKIMPKLIGNPVYHWSHLELKRYFQIDELLDADTAESIWQAANAVLQGEKGDVRTLIRQSNVKGLCTTDDPADDLRYHQLLAQQPDFRVEVLPTFRPEKALDIANPDFPGYIHRLGITLGKTLRTVTDIQQALYDRIAFFKENGCCLSDHSFGAPDFTIWDEKAAEDAVQKALAGQQPTPYEVGAYQSLLMDGLGEQYAKHGFAMQLHFGAQRNLSTRIYQNIGADAGGDAIGDSLSAASLAALLDRLSKRGCLPRTILYTLNAADNDKFAAVAGSFQDESIAGKIQFGSAWWFNDHLDGMESQLRSFANIGVLSRFVGMLTDSRSFLSYPRHEYFRRILCRLIGSQVNEGLAPVDYPLLGGMIQDICFHNICRFLGKTGQPGKGELML